MSALIFVGFAVIVGSLVFFLDQSQDISGYLFNAIISFSLYPIDIFPQVVRFLIYFTGLSMGGYGTWHLAAEYPERFAATAPICGGAVHFAGFPEKVRALKDVPVWTFHGARDRVVPLAESADPVSTLKACGASCKFTIYPDAEHDSWTETYDNPELYEWFLKHDKS